MEKVIRLWSGIGCEREHTLEEIGQEFDATFFLALLGYRRLWAL